MAKRADIHKILIIGSGPINIGQAAEFDYAGTQACLSLKEEGYETLLVNSNPATIMTDKDIADIIYMEPLTLEYVAKIIRMERPQALIPSLGGQTGINLAVQLHESGVLDECGCEVLGTKIEALSKAEDRALFKALCESIGEPVLPSDVAVTVDQALDIAGRIGYPVVLRPAFTLGGTGGGFCDLPEELPEMAENALNVSPVGQVLIERSVKGFKEIEYEVMRDKNDTAIAVCNMENINPVGVHTGDSIVVCPSQTLTNKEYHMLRDASLKIIRALKIEGGCNVQFALDPFSFRYYVIEVNPRVSRSSALASKASGYPIARVSAKIAVGMTLDEIMLKNSMACFEPSLDYIVTKIPRFPFDKFDSANRELTTQMKATGEVMAVGRTFEESFLKALRSTEIEIDYFKSEVFEEFTRLELSEFVKKPTDQLVFAIAALLRKNVDLNLIYQYTKIDLFFLHKFKNIVETERFIKERPGDIGALRTAKRFGFSDKVIARLWGAEDNDVRELRKRANIIPVYKMIDSCAGEFDSYIPYFYSTYADENESVVTDRESILVIGSGPIRIGQGIEFDYSSVHAIKTINQMGYEAIVVNNNPETVSTDYTISDKLYFEPLTIEEVMNVADLEKPVGAVVQLGGQTAINLAQSLTENGVRILGTDLLGIQTCENRGLFEIKMRELGLPQPPGKAVFDLDEGLKVADAIGYPVLVRPSYVLGGRAMRIIYNDDMLMQYLNTAVNLNHSHPVLIDKFIKGKEVEVDAVCDGADVYIPGIMEHIESAGIHSGDSISVYPAYSISEGVKRTIFDYTVRLGLGLGIVGLFNIQFVVKGEEVSVIEVNPRSSRTVPFLSKAADCHIANIATKVMLGVKLKELGCSTEIKQTPDKYYIKAPTFSFSKIKGMDTILGPEMKSTGETIGYDRSMTRAVYKALCASGMKVKKYGAVLVTVDDIYKQDILPYVKTLYELGFNFMATSGTSAFMREHGIPSSIVQRLDVNNDIIDTLRKNYISYIINLTVEQDYKKAEDARHIRAVGIENNVTVLTSIDTVGILVTVLKEIVVGVGRF